MGIYSLGKFFTGWVIKLIVFAKFQPLVSQKGYFKIYKKSCHNRVCFQTEPWWHTTTQTEAEYPHQGEGEGGGCC